MKRFIALCLCITLFASANAKPLPVCDVPLLKTEKLSVNPTVFGLTVYKSGTSGNLVIDFYLTGDTGSNEWKTTIAVKTYTRIGWNNWQWITVFYNVYTDPGDQLGYAEFAIPGYNQYTWAPNGAPGPNGHYIVDDSQFWVAAEPVPVQ